MEPNDPPLTKSKPLALSLCLIVVIGIGILDYLTGYEIRLFPLYFLPVALAAWRLSVAATLAMASLSAVAWVLSNYQAGGTYASALTWPVNFLAQLVAFVTIGLLVATLRQQLVREQALGRRDPLTGLANSRAFLERGELLVALSRRSARPFTLAYLDLDNFKAINDERGHQEGDRALTRVAEVLASQCRSSDLVARLGGDEFGILLPDTGPDAAHASLERVRDLIAAEMRKNRWPVTISAGAVSYAIAPTSLEEVIKEADALMYRAKERGKNRTLVESREPRAAEST